MVRIRAVSHDCICCVHFMYNKLSMAYLIRYEYAAAFKTQWKVNTQQAAPSPIFARSFPATFLALPS